MTLQRINCLLKIANSYFCRTKVTICIFQNAFEKSYLQCILHKEGKERAFVGCIWIRIAFTRHSDVIGLQMRPPKETDSELRHSNIDQLVDGHSDTLLPSCDKELHPHQSKYTPPVVGVSMATLFCYLVQVRNCRCKQQSRGAVERTTEQT